ncbi:MAG: hypothetical protein HOW73_27370 [Polyangiaceae bacterium]|nr:hypothetical protein [Polyangiaceae bacterium]
MKIGDWKATRGLNEQYRHLRELGLETNIAELETFGFTVVENAIPLELVDRLVERILAVSAERLGLDAVEKDGSNHQETTQALNYLLAEGRCFEEALMLPKAVALHTYMLGESYVVNALQAFVKGPGAPALRLHIDSPFPEPLPRHSQAANVNFLLTDYTAEGGALRFVPGSHRFCRHPTAAEMAMEDMMVPIEAPRGSIVAFHGTTWHSACPKTSSGLRINLIYYACRYYIRPQEFYLNRLPKEVLERNPERFTRIVGGDLPFTDSTYDMGKATSFMSHRFGQHR